MITDRYLAPTVRQVSTNPATAAVIYTTPWQLVAGQASSHSHRGQQKPTGQATAGQVASHTHRGQQFD